MSRSSRPTPSLNVHASPSMSSNLLDGINPDQYDREMMDLLKKKGVPLFTVHDLRTTQHTLSQILRLMCIMDNISKESLREHHRRSALKAYTPSNKITEEFNNLSRAIMFPKVTWDFFEKFLFTTEKRLIDMILIVEDMPTGIISEYKKSDVEKMIRAEPTSTYTYPPYPQLHNVSTLTPIVENDTPTQQG